MSLSETEYTNALIERIKSVMEYGGLTVSGLAEFARISESHLYAILKGRRRITENIADRIASLFGLTGSELLRIDTSLSRKLKRTQELKRFYLDNSSVTSYFTDSKKEFKAPKYIHTKILVTEFFQKPKRVVDVREKLRDDGIKLSSKQVSQILNYMVVQGKLRKKKIAIILEDGQLGKRQIDVFFK